MSAPPKSAGLRQKKRAYRSIQIDYRQTFFLRTINCNYRYRIVLPEEFIFITETDLWESLQKFLITDTDSLLKSH